VAKASQAFRNVRSRTLSKATRYDESEIDNDESGGGDDDESFVIQDLHSKNNEQGDKFESDDGSKVDDETMAILIP
jgi:hypothetical protein